MISISSEKDKNITENPRSANTCHYYLLTLERIDQLWKRSVNGRCDWKIVCFAQKEDDVVKLIPKVIKVFLADNWTVVAL
jgi:hypothetical protein